MCHFPKTIKLKLANSLPSFGFKIQVWGRDKSDWFNKSVGLLSPFNGVRRLTVTEQITDSIEASVNVGGLRFSGGINFLFRNNKFNSLVRFVKK